MSLNTTDPWMPRVTSSVSSGGTYFNYVNTVPPGGLPLPPRNYSASGVFVGRCFMTLAPAYATWIYNNSWPTVATAHVTLGPNNTTVGVSRECTTSQQMTSVYGGNMGGWFDDECKLVATYINRAGESTPATANQIDGPSSIFDFGTSMRISWSLWQTGTSELDFVTKFTHLPVLYTDELTLWTTNAVPTAYMPSLASMFPNLSELMDLCGNNVTFMTNPNTLRAANYLTVYTTLSQTAGAGLTHVPPVPTSSTVPGRPPVLPDIPAETLTQENPPQMTESPASPIDVDTPQPLPSGQIVNSPLPTSNNAPQPAVVIDGTNTMRPGAAPTTIAGHEIHVPVDPPRPSNTVEGSDPPTSQEVAVVVIDSTTIFVESLNAHFPTALPELQRAGVGAVLSPVNNGGQKGSAGGPALIVDGTTMMPGASAVTINGRVISMPAQIASSPDGSRGIPEAIAGEMLVVVDGATMPLSEATALPELRNAGVSVMTGVGMDGGDGGAFSGPSRGEGVADWIMRALRVSSTASASTARGSGVNRPGAGGGTGSSGNRASNGTVPFTGSGPRLRPAWSVLVGLCAAGAAIGPA
ncbi:Hypothetical protein D9617_8g051530 [Elsinoe fawcettii]|nr:Hypothetical protein D9617_8g051530 [Elsinoe fawcettii]